MVELIRPLPGVRTITQIFGPTAWTGEPPAYGYPHFHLGVDYAADCGELVYAPGDGKIVFAGWDTTGYGLCLWIDHRSGLRSCLAHLKEVMVGHGQEVRKQQPVGLAGTTGNSTGCHLHYGVTLNGVYVAPATVMDLRTW